MPRLTSLAATGLTFLLATRVAANPIALYRELMKRDPPAALPENATPGELKWQPVLDLYVPARASTRPSAPGPGLR